MNCYYEAYQHTVGAEERFALAQVITDIMHRRPQLDLSLDYFVRTYRAETCCLQRHQQLIRGILDNQVPKIMTSSSETNQVSNFPLYTHFFILDSS